VKPTEEEEEDDEVKEAREKEEAERKQKEKMDKQIRTIMKLYSESFLRRLLRLVEIFTSIATVSPYPLSMVQRVANPHQLETLFNIMIHASPRLKMVAVKVVHNLLKIDIPFQIFEEAITIMEKKNKQI